MGSKPKVILYSDGSVAPKNPGVGGWGAVLIYGDRIKGMYGTLPHATNNYMEVYAVLLGLKGLKKPCIVNIYSDSQYAVEGLKAIHYNRMLKTNQDLWREMRTLAKVHRIAATHVDGHATTYYNELAHELAGLGSRYQTEGYFYVHELEETSAEAQLLKKVERRIKIRKGRQEASLAGVA